MGRVEHLRRARDEMDRRYAEPLDIGALAATALASEAHFIRSFKREFGETPHRYLQRRRIERAATLLRETDRTVTEIALDVGFQGLSWFTTAFREIMGETPTAYRDRPPRLARLVLGPDHRRRVASVLRRHGGRQGQRAREDRGQERRERLPHAGLDRCCPGVV